MTTVGIEVEMSDIRVVEAARIVYEYFGRPFSSWQDRWGPYDKPDIDYTQWHVMSDGSLYNADGSRCMWTYVDENGVMRKASSSKKSPDRQKWKGAELIGPATSDFMQLGYDLQNLVTLLHSNGATFTRKNVNALHVHVDISEVDFENLRQWPRLIYEMQDTFDILSTKWKKRAFYTEESVERLEAARDQKQFWDEYRFVKGQIRHGSFDGHRRLIDIGPWFNDSKSYKTVEFRGFSATSNVDHMLGCIELAVDTVKSLCNGSKVENLENRVNELEKSYVASY